MANYLIQVLGNLKEVAAVLVSTGAADSGKIPALGANGRFDNSFMPVGLGAETKIITAFEALAAGDFVNVFSNAGTLSVRKADASSNSKQAHGFVLAAVAATGQATVYYGNINDQQSGLTLGGDMFLSSTAPGKATGVIPVGTGKIVQRLGVATSATEILVEIGQTVELA